jgi:hypothetical protein
MSSYKTSDGMAVDVIPMEAYPDGLLLGIELTAIALPMIGALPSGAITLFKQAATSGEEGALQVALMALLAPDPAAEGESGKEASSLFQGLARVLLSISDRARFLRISGELLKTLTVEHNGKRRELIDQNAIKAVTGQNIKLLVELLAIAFRGNLASFTSGAGGTSNASAAG